MEQGLVQVGAMFQHLCDGCLHGTCAWCCLLTLQWFVLFARQGLAPQRFLSPPRPPRLGPAARPLLLVCSASCACSLTCWWWLTLVVRYRYPLVPSSSHVCTLRITGASLYASLCELCPSMSTHGLGGSSMVVSCCLVCVCLW
jgi:hypothetical protein